MASVSEIRVGLEVLETSVHWTPCRFTPAPGATLSSSIHVNCTFEGSQVRDVRLEPADTLQATLRGRTLAGCEIALPEGYTGIIASLVPVQTDACPRVWDATSTFSKVTYWNHDAPPTASDPQRRAMDWLELAGQVHTAISCEAVDTALQEMDAQMAS